MKAINELKCPVYIRFGREAVPDFTVIDLKTEIGKGQLMREGKDVTIIVTGHLTWGALMAADELSKMNIDARVINIHTIKPLDNEIILSAARETGAFVTAEEHQLMGGFGSAVCEVLAQYCPVPVEMVGVRDTFGESGKPDELMKKYGMTSAHIVAAGVRAIKRK